MSFLRPVVGRALLCLGLSGIAMPVWAVTQIPQPLSLDAALSWASDNNPTLRGARIRIERAGGQAIHADVAVPSNPRIELDGAQRRQSSGSGADIGIRVSQTFWIAGQGGLNETVAGNELAAAKADYAFLSAAIAARTRAAFLSVLVAERAVTTAQRVVETNQRLADYADKRLSAGAGTQLENNSATLGLQRARALLAGARNTREQARLLLKDLLAIDPARRLTLSGQLDFAPLALPAQTDLLNKAVARRGDLDAAARRVVAARGELSLAAREIIPNLTVFGFYRQEAGGRSSGNGADIAGGGIGFDIPLMHRFEGERQIARADLAQARLDQDTLQREVRQQVLSAISAYESASERARALNNGVLDAAENTLELTRRSFAAGQVGAPAITSAQNTLIDIRREYLDALSALISAGTDLERATGGLLVMDSATTTAGIPNDFSR